MTKVQMIVTESEEIINFDHVIAMRVKEKYPKDKTAMGISYAIVAYVGVGDRVEEHDIRKDYEMKDDASLDMLMIIDKAKQTDGIARFDGDIMARLHEKGV